MINANAINVTERAKKIYDRFLARASRDDEFKDWADYRAKLTDFIVNNTAPGGSLLILGAGKCNDLDLGKLADHCGSITLSDYRPESAEEAFCRYGLTPSEHLNFLASDYVGIPDRDYLEYTDLLLTVMQRLAGGAGESREETPGTEQNQVQESLEEIAGPELAKLQDTLERIYQENENYRIDLGDRTYDNAVIAGVHSQLNNAFRGIFQYVRKDVEDGGEEVKLAGELNAAIFRTTGQHSAFLVRRFNEAVFERAAEGIIYGYEQNIIYTPEGSVLPAIGTVDGARQAGEEIADMQAADHMTCLWPLSRRRNIKFEMSVSYLPLNERQAEPGGSE